MRIIKRTVFRDPFLLAHKRWKKVKGDQTLRFDYDLNDTSIVLDVGGFEGNYADDIHQRFGCKIFVFEPAPHYADICQKRFQNNDQITVLDYGLSDKDETVLLSDDGDGSSAFREKGGSAQSVDLRAIKPVMANLSIEQVDLMKINIEGGEYPLLQAMIDDGLLEKVRYLQVQFHDFVPHAQETRAAIRQNLEKTHIEQWCFPFVWESWKRR